MKTLTKSKLASAIALAILAGGSGCMTAPEVTEPPASTPNFVTIVIDDMGYSDIGIFGGEVPTPNMDQLANDGVILSNFYAAATSSVSRSMLYTGKDNHRVGMGTMREQIKRAPRDELLGQPNYEGVMSLDQLPFPEVLQDNNYHTMMTGKWHMGGDEEGEEEYYPINRGFSATKTLLLGGGDLDFWKNENGDFLTEHFESYGGRKSLYNDNGVETDFTDLPKLAHSSASFTNAAIDMVENRDKSKPFYLNVSYLSPHVPLQAPKDLIDKYVDTYSVGWDVIRAERFERLKELGHIDASAELSPRPANVRAWDDLTDRERRFETQRMAIYMAEIDYLDQNIGRLVQSIKDAGEYENTVFFVYSDNGAADVGFGHIPPGIENHNRVKVNDISQEEFDRIIGKLGSATSFVGPTVDWGHVNGTPFRGYKGASLEGGSRGAAFVHYAGSKTKGITSHCLHSVMDIGATALEMANVSYPTEHNGQPNAPMDGVSMAALFAGDASCDTDRVLGMEFNGVSGLRKGDFKLGQGYNEGSRPGLYNLRSDPAELNDLTEEMPELYAEMKALYAAYAADVGVIEVNHLYLPDLADSAATSAKIRGGISPLDAVNKTGSFKEEGSFPASASVSIAGEVRAEAAHVGQSAEVFVNITDTDSGKTVYLTEDGLVEAGSAVAYKTMEMPTMLPLSIVHGVLADTALNGSSNLEVRIGYKPEGGDLIENTNKPIKVSIAG